MNVKEAVQIELKELQQEPLNTLYADIIALYTEFLEQETDMDWDRFQELIVFMAGDFGNMINLESLGWT